MSSHPYFSVRKRLVFDTLRGKHVIIIIIIIIRNLYSAIMPLRGYRGAGKTGR